MRELLVGNLTWESLPHEWFTVGGAVFFIGAGLFLVFVLTYLKRWKWLWKECRRR